MNNDKIILHLCASEYGSDTRDYREAGYDVRMITKKIGVEGYHPPKNVYGIIANPPYTMFSIARTCAKTPRDLREGMRLVQECLRIIWEAQYDLEKPNDRHIILKFWAIENPYTGMLKYFLGKPAFIYSPQEFGGNFTKKTALWGNFNPPQRPLMNYQIPKGNSVNDKFTPMSHNRNWDDITDQRSIASPFFYQSIFSSQSIICHPKK
jgi:hypothetical protein